jgi:NADH:ubiquinone oxidoreductase subunit B-like Fe-S oxidoreductase
MVMGTSNGTYLTHTSKCQNQDGLLQLALVLPQEVFSTPTLQGIDKVIPVDVYVPGCPKTGANRRWCNEQELVRTET